jgi:hypothetical protein
VLSIYAFSLFVMFISRVAGVVVVSDSGFSISLNLVLLLLVILCFGFTTTATVNPRRCRHHRATSRG